jgi:hypothetical protein
MDGKLGMKWIGVIIVGVVLALIVFKLLDEYVLKGLKKT